MPFIAFWLVCWWNLLMSLDMAEKTDCLILLTAYPHSNRIWGIINVQIFNEKAFT